MALKKLYLSADNVTWIDSSTYGIYLNSDTYLNAPTIGYTEYSVPSRIGSLVNYNHRFSNVIRRFDCYIKTSFTDIDYGKFLKWIYTHPGYIYIKTDYESSYYQKGYLAQDIEVTPFVSGTPNYSIQFSIYFSCDPRKHLNTVSELTKNAVSNGVVSKDDPFVRSVLSQVSYYNLTDDIVYKILKISNVAGTFTNVSASWSDGPDFFACFKANNDLSDTPVVFGSGLNSLPTISSITTVSNEKLYLIFGFRSTGSVNYSISGSSVSVSLTNTEHEITSGIEYVGIDLGTIHFTMKDDGAEPGYSHIFIKRYIDNEEVGEGLIVIHKNDGMDISEYASVNVGGVTVYGLNVNLENYACYLSKTGKENLNIGKYVNIIGNPTGLCDKITAQLYTGSGAFVLSSAKFKADRWKV